jgi:hypothetical protein
MTKRSRRVWPLSVRLTVVAVLPVCLSGCTLFNVSPTLEAIKALGAAANSAISVTPTSASNLVFHPPPPVTSLCIEYNRAAQVPDLLQAIQAELLVQGVESRVYELSAPPAQCKIWLSYMGYMEWGTPSLGEGFEPFLTSAAFTLRQNGEVLASASYEQAGLEMGKWATTRKKIAAAIRGIIKGPN